jgi:hypothetical protein
MKRVLKVGRALRVFPASQPQTRAITTSQTQKTSQKYYFARFSVFDNSLKTTTAVVPVLGQFRPKQTARPNRKFILVFFSNSLFVFKK